MLAGPVAVALRMHKEGCRGWAGEGKDRQVRAAAVGRGVKFRLGFPIVQGVGPGLGLGLGLG
jgi:hypothetical protein